MTQRRMIRGMDALSMALALYGGTIVGCADDADINTDNGHADAGHDDVRGGATAADASVTEVPEAFLADAGDGWTTLITGRWQLEAGTESYRCVRFTLPQDVYMASIRALSPLGTHHTVLTVGDPDAPDGMTTCNAQTNARRNVAGSGVGTNDFDLPEGVAAHMRAGQQLLLNLHLFNVSNEPLSGVSGTLFRAMAEKDVKTTAEAVLAGPINLNIPVGGPTLQSGKCTLKSDTTLIAVLPHMHQLGVHMKVIAMSSVQGEVLLHDRDYSFDEQIFYKLDEEVKMKAGDTVQVECTYVNTTAKPVVFGDSSLAEMCFAGLVRYPESSESFICTN